MGFFKRDVQAKRSQIANTPQPMTHSYVVPQDGRKAICPSCNGQLAKVPGAKTKCPKCGEYMFVRTDPHSRIRVLVTTTQADAIDDEIARLNGTYEQRLKEKKRKEKIESDLTKKFKGKQPSKEDIQWRILNQDGIKWARNHWWSSYSLNLSQKAEACEQRGKYKQALEFFLKSAYLEYNGANDVGQDALSRRQLKSLGFKEFDPHKAIRPPFAGVGIKRTSNILKLGLDTLESIFIKVSSEMKIAGIPLEPRQVWQDLKADL